MARRASPSPREFWARHLPAYDRARAYGDALRGLVADSDVPEGWVEMALSAIHTAHRNWWELSLHIKGAYAAGVSEMELAEAISYAMFPGSIPNFVDACGVWQGMIARGEAPASPVFALWGASAAEQKGFDGA